MLYYWQHKYVSVAQAQAGSNLNSAKSMPLNDI